jgi:putative transposase
MSSSSEINSGTSIKAFRFALRASPEQERLLRRYAGQLRWIWNRALAEQKARHSRSEKYAGHAEMCKWLTVWRNAPETVWLAEGPMHPQQQVLKRLDEAYKRFFAKAGGFPQFKARGQEPGIRFPDPKQFEIEQSMVGPRDNLPSQAQLPQAKRLAAWCDTGRIKLSKVGWLRLRQSKEVTGELRNITLTRVGTKWFCSVQTRGPQVLP